MAIVVIHMWTQAYQTYTDEAFSVKQYGVDFSSLDYIVVGKVKSGTDFITRPAPGLGDDAGGAIELESFYMIGDGK